MSKIHIETAQGLLNAPGAREIRQKVFVQEQGFQLEFDQTDSIAWHAVLWIDQTPAATGRTFPTEEPHVFIIGRIAVLPTYRGLSLGSQIVTHLEKQAVMNGAQQIRLSAQLQALNFYKKLNYQGVGDVFYDESVPHITMIKSFLP